jgi:hypothetical protein
MKLPAVAITATFASGIALGLHPAIATHPASNQLLLASFLAAVALLFAGMVLVKMGQLFPAAFDSLLCWILLGFLGTCVARLPRPAGHVTSLVEQGHLDLKRHCDGMAIFAMSRPDYHGAMDMKLNCRASSMKARCGQPWAACG